MMMRRNQSISHCSIPKPRNDAKSFTYISDGSGRDSYVIKGNGGLVADYRTINPDKMFYSSLRQHEILPEPRKRNYHLSRGSVDNLYFDNLKPINLGNRSQTFINSELKRAVKQIKTTDRLSPHRKDSWIHDRLKGENERSPARQK